MMLLVLKFFCVWMNVGHQKNETNVVLFTFISQNHSLGMRDHNAEWKKLEDKRLLIELYFSLLWSSNLVLTKFIHQFVPVVDPAMLVNGQELWTKTVLSDLGVRAIKVWFRSKRPMEKKVCTTSITYSLTILQWCWKINRGITSGSSFIRLHAKYKLLSFNCIRNLSQVSIFLSRHDNWNKAFKFSGTNYLPISSLDEIHWWLSIFRKPIWFFLLLMIVREVWEFCVCASEPLKTSTTRRKTHGWFRGKAT